MRAPHRYPHSGRAPRERRARCCRALAWVLAQSTLGAAALGQPASPADAEGARASARLLAQRGIERFKLAQYPEALRLFRQAEAVYHAPTHLLYIARAQAQLGAHLEAHATYMALDAERLPIDAPASFLDAQALAAQEAQALCSRVVCVRVVVSGTVAEPVTIRVDGATIPPERASRPMAFAAGEHLFEALAARAGAVSQRVRLEATGAMQVVGLALAPARAVSSPPPRPEESGVGPLLPSGIVIVATGGAALTAAIVTGAVALNEADTALAPCSEGICPRSREPEIEAAGSLADVSTGLFVGGGVAVVVGAILLLAASGGGDGEPGASHRPAPLLGGEARRVGFAF
jgi:hypothetical protein